MGGGGTHTCTSGLWCLPGCGVRGWKVLFLRPCFIRSQLNAGVLTASTYQAKAFRILIFGGGEVWVIPGGAQGLLPLSAPAPRVERALAACKAEHVPSLASPGIRFCLLFPNSSKPRPSFLTQPGSSLVMSRRVVSASVFPFSLFYIL